jgi:hypothetical protein
MIVFVPWGICCTCRFVLLGDFSYDSTNIYIANKPANSCNKCTSHKCCQYFAKKEIVWNWSYLGTDAAFKSLFFAVRPFVFC